METKPIWGTCAALLVTTCLLSSSVVFAEEGPEAVEAAARIASPGPSAGSRYDEALRPGMVLRTWRVPATYPAALRTSGSVPPGVPGPDDADHIGFPPCPPAPPGVAPQPYEAGRVHPVSGYEAPPAGSSGLVWPEDEPPPPPPVEEVPVMPAEDEGAEEVVVEEVIVVERAPAPAPASAAPCCPPRLVRTPSPQLPNLGGVCDPECAQKRDACCWPVDPCGRRYGRFELTVEGMFSVPNAPNGLLGETIFGAADQFDWASTDYGFELGARGTARYAVSPGKWLEARFTWYGDKWNDTAAPFNGRFGFTPGPGGVGGASAPAVGVLSSEAEMWSGEVNFVGEFECSGCWRWDLIAGFRTMRFDETANVTWPGGVLVGAGPAFVNSAVENHLLGAQFGIGTHWDLSPSFTMNLSLKAIMGDLSRKAQVNDTSIFVGGAHSARSTQTEMVFGTDIELGCRWRLTRCIAITAGYNMFFLDNVLRANDAMDFSKSVSGAVQARDAVDQLIVHSFFAGVNINL